MSIVIIAMTKETVVAVSDSLMIGDKPNEQTPKLYQYSPTLAFYGVGNAGITMGLFSLLDNMKQDYGDRIAYVDAVNVLRSWKDWLENTFRDTKIGGAVGVCGINNGVPEATTILVDTQHQQLYCNVTKPNDQLVFYCLPPSDLHNDQCNRAFIANCSCISGRPDQFALIAAASKTIEDLSAYSRLINDRVQYWSYDLKQNYNVSRLLDLLV